MAALWELVGHDHPFAGLIAVIVVSYVVGGAIYRLYFSPLAKFPGPKLAALTLWYEFYYGVIKKGQYTFKIRRMHQKYGWCIITLYCEKLLLLIVPFLAPRPNHSDKPL